MNRHSAQLLVRSLTSVVAVAYASVVWGGSLSPDMDVSLEKAQQDSAVAVILRIKEQPDRVTLMQANVGETRHERTARVARLLREMSERSQKDIQSELARESLSGGVEQHKSLWITNGIAVKAKPAVIRRLAARADVAEVVPDRVVTLSTPQVVPASVVNGANLVQVGAPVLWNKGIKGQGIVVASLDTGVDVNHPALQGKWRGGPDDWSDPHKGTTTPYDVSGHGTAVTGIMVGGNTTDNLVGMAPEAQWIAAKIFDDAGNTTLSTIHAAFQWLLDPDGNPATPDSPDIANNSWELANTGLYDAEFQNDINTLRAAGIAVVFAAGNEGPAPGTSVSPGNNQGAFPVGVVDNSGTIALFSSRGPSALDGSIYPALVAPGVNVRSSYVGGGYATFSGTSVSAPHVAGAMALLKSALPGLTVTDAETALQQSVVGPGGPDNNYGWGRLDVGKAYAYLAAPGDVNGDGRIDVVDVLILLNAIVNPVQQTALIVKNADLSPLGADVKPQGNGVLDIADALLLLRRAMGIVTW